MALSATVISGIIGLFSKGVDKVSSAVQSVKEQKNILQTAQAKLAIARQEGDTNLKLSTAEWEAISKQSEGNGWKDEYVTIVITLPLLTQFVCTLIGSIFNLPGLIAASVAANDSVIAILPNYERILEVVVYAAVSIRVLDKAKS